jgi:outer membrane protein OmpA-like peptidoglycan-associated protein
MKCNEGQNRGRKTPETAAGGLAVFRLKAITCVVFVAAVLALFAPAAVLYAQVTPGGTDIVNTANAAYIAASSGATSLSNPVTTRVLETYSLRVGPPGTVATPAFQFSGVPGDTFYCRLTLDNLGNAPDSASMAAATLAPPSTLAPPAVIFFLDGNGNGRFDVGEDDPAFLAVAAGASAPVDVAIALPPTGGGTAYVELRATSAVDPNLVVTRRKLLAPATDATVVRVTSVAGPALIHMGPPGNPRALPGGEGSPDDAAAVAIGLYDESVALPADIENAGDADSVEVFAAIASPLPPGVTLACTDSSGVPFPASPRPGRFMVGAFAPGEVRPVRFVVSSPGTPLRVSLGMSAAIVLSAQSRADTTMVNHTQYQLAIAQAPDARTILGLDQTFRQPTGALGDVVTMVVTATNRTDSVRVDQVIVTEDAPPSLDFLAGEGVTRSGSRLVWAVGTLAPGESRSTALKFAVNSRESKGWARATGVASGLAQTGGSAQTGQVVAAIRIDNEEIGIEGFVLGDVWIDDDEDGRRDEGERGAPNVSVYLESGEYAVTDSSGVFSIPHVFEGRRVVRLDEGTLPAGAELVRPPLDDTQAPRPNERLVHLIAPAHVRVSFPLRMPVAPPVARKAALVCEEHVNVVERPRTEPTFTLPSSQFALGKAALLFGARAELLPVALFLIDHPQYTALIEGHTDALPMRSGQFRSNQELSEARAQAVCDALVTMGVPAERFLVLGYGETRPIASNATDDGRSMNRRVDISVIPPANNALDPALRIGTAIRDLSSLPDSVGATVRWSFATTSERVQRATIRLDVPRLFDVARITVTHDSMAVAEKGGEFVVAGLARGERIECRIAFMVAAADTHLIRDIRATVRLDDAAAPSDSTARTVAIRPRDSRTSIAMSDAVTWTELVKAPAATAAAPVAIVPPGDPAPSPHDGPVAILDPFDGFVASNSDQVSVRARHPLGSRISLVVAGDEIGEERVGQRTVDVAHQEETTTWYGVRLRGGWNEIVVRAQLLHGGEVTDTVRVALATRPAEIVPLDARALIPADGRSAATLRFAVRDGFGLPVMDGFIVDVVEGEELALATDARPAERGLQIATSEGIVSVPLRPRHATGTGRIAVERDGMRAETEVVFVNPERPLLATGVVDVAMGTYRTRGDGSGHGVTNYRDGFDAEAEARAFVQGAAPGGFRVTARLDTKKRYDDPLLKQPDPEKQYPIFGDASTVHYAAPARGGNYVSIDRGQSFLRYSDFQTPIDRGEFLTYHQVVTGLSAAVVDGPTAFRAFVTQTDLVTRTDNIPADGTSGFYYLTLAPVVENSERVIVETRDRYQSEKVLEARVMMRRRDYVINPYDGSILFMEPVPVTDRYLNPNIVVVTYETESGAADVYLFGARGDVARGNRYRAGITAVANGGDAPGYALFGADGEARVRGIRIAGEFARSEDDIEGSGNAYKIGAGAQRGLSKLDLYLRRVDGDFSNPSFRGADSELASLKAGFEGRLAAPGSLALNADGYTHELQRTGERRGTVRTTVDYRRRLLEMSAGLRLARHDEPQEDSEGLLTLLGLAIGSRSGTGIATTWEQNVGAEIVDDYPNRLRTTLGVPLSQRFRLIATHEYLTASGRSTTNQITAGIEGTTASGTQAYTRYAMDRAAGDARMGAVSGIRQRLALGRYTGATIGVEAFTSLTGRHDEEYVAFTTGLGARRPGSYFVDGGYEYRWERPGDKHLLRIAAAQQLGGGFAWLAKNILGLNEANGQHDGTQCYTTLAGAYRSPHAPVQSLVMLKSYYDRYTPLDPDAISWRLVASTDVNVLANASHEVRLKYAYKHMEDWSYGLSLSSDTDVALAQYVWHFGRGWDLDAWGRTVVLRRGGTSQTGAGIEVGRMVYRSVRLGVGYSVNGFDDPDVTGTDAWSEGLGIRIQMILSDWMLSDFERLK